MGYKLKKKKRKGTEAPKQVAKRTESVWASMPAVHSQFDTPRCPVCRYALVAQVLRGGVIGFPCPCNGWGRRAFA